MPGPYLWRVKKLYDAGADGLYVHQADARVLGSEEYDSDGVIPPGKHTLLVRAKDGDGWLEQTFTIVGA